MQKCGISRRILKLMIDSNSKESVTLFQRKDLILKKEFIASTESLNLKNLKKKILAFVIKNKSQNLIFEEKQNVKSNC